MYRPQQPLGILLIDTTDRYGRRIILEKSRFDEHIGCINGHIEMADNADAIKETIENPYWILQSSKDENRFLYIGKSDKSTYPKLHIKTVVEHSEQEFGFVVTSMFQRRLKLEKEGSIIYAKEEESEDKS